MYGFLATPNDPTTAIINLENKTYFCLSLLSKVEDILIPVDARSIILGIFDLVLYSEDNLSPSRDGIPLGALDDLF